MSETPEAEATPFLAQWKTNPGFVILGIYAGLLTEIILGAILRTANWSGILFAFTLLVAYLVGVLVWFFAIYPTLFGSNPRMDSNEGVAFCNGFFGGWLFGPICCHDLTSKWRGFAYIIRGGFCALMLLYFFNLILLS